jgi:DNA-directed RNA polymerase subunit RPC12/RpoP
MTVAVDSDTIEFVCSTCKKPWRMNAADPRPQTACECGGRVAVGTVTFTDSPLESDATLAKRFGFPTY